MILVVDDSETELEVTKLVLEQVGFEGELLTSPDGREAIDLLWQLFQENRLPDIILCDLNLENIGGLSLIKRLRNIHEFRLIPIIILSGADFSDDVKACYEAGANAYIKKPADLTSKIDVVRNLLQFWLTDTSLPYQS